MNLLVTQVMWNLKIISINKCFFNVSFPSVLLTCFPQNIILAVTLGKRDYKMSQLQQFAVDSCNSGLKFHISTFLCTTDDVLKFSVSLLPLIMKVDELLPSFCHHALFQSPSKLSEVNTTISLIFRKRTDGEGGEVISPKSGKFRMQKGSLTILNYISHSVRIMQ